LRRPIGIRLCVIPSAFLRQLFGRFFLISRILDLISVFQLTLPLSIKIIGKTFISIKIDYLLLGILSDFTMSSIISNSDLLANRNQYRMSTLTYYFAFSTYSTMQYLLGHLVGRLLQPFHTMSAQCQTKTKFCFRPCRREKFFFVPIYAMVPIILRFGRSLT